MDEIQTLKAKIQQLEKKISGMAIHSDLHDRIIKDIFLFITAEEDKQDELLAHIKDEYFFLG